MKIKAKTENDTEFTNNFFSSCVHSWKCPSLSSWVLVLCLWVQFSVPTESVPSGCGPRCHHTSICCLSDRCSGHLQKPLDELSGCGMALFCTFLVLFLSRAPVRAPHSMSCWRVCLEQAGSVLPFDVHTWERALHQRLCASPSAS